MLVPSLGPGSFASLALRSLTCQPASPRKTSLTIRKRLFSSSPSTTDDHKPLEAVRPGTTPPYDGLLVLHTSTPSHQWPSHPNLNSLLIRELTLRLKHMKMGLNISQDPTLPLEAARLAGTEGGPGDTEEVYSATLYRASNPPLRISRVSLDSVHSLLERLKSVSAGSTPTDFETGELLS